MEVLGILTASHLWPDFVGCENVRCVPLGETMAQWTGVTFSTVTYRMLFDSVNRHLDIQLRKSYQESLVSRHWDRGEGEVELTLVAYRPFGSAITFLTMCFS